MQDAAQEIPQRLLTLWAQMLANMGLQGGPSGPIIGLTGLGASKPVSLDNERLLALQQQYLDAAQQLWRDAAKPDGVALNDRRFDAQEWQQNPLMRYVCAQYLLNAQTLLAMAEAVDSDAKTHARLEFYLRQLINAGSPANFLATNPEALRLAAATEGKSLAQGLQNLIHDLSQGHMAQTDEQAFKLGENLATTPGSVVFENAWFQLIEYAPSTEQVHATPILLVPPCINKFYILDLQAENSFVRHLVAQGHRTFLISWRNADAALQHSTWDDYVESGVLRAIRTVCAICQIEAINTLGFCIGGTLLANALAVLAARQDPSVVSATLLTTLIDFSDTGILDIFIDEGLVRLREKQFAAGGLLLGKDLASTFNFLRPNELVWNYVQNNYLKGQTPRPFDLLYWNSDVTNLPGPMYAWYLRNTYLENRLVQPGACHVAGAAIDLSRIKMPVYLYASREDHIVPPQAAWRSQLHLTGAQTRFVLGASGHIAGVINPPAAGKRQYWTHDAATTAASHSYEEWLADAQEKPGSWWPHWYAWLAQQAGTLVAAPKQVGNANYPALEAAPGRYVRVRASTGTPPLSGVNAQP